MNCQLFNNEYVVQCVCHFCADKSSRRIGALQHLGEKGDKMTAMLVQVREILPKYRSGALPKVFKVLPKFEAWEEVHVCVVYIV